MDHSGEDHHCSNDYKIGIDFNHLNSIYDDNLGTPEARRTPTKSDNSSRVHKLNIPDNLSH